MNKMNQLIGPNALGLYPGGLVKVGFELNNLMTLNLAWKASWVIVVALVLVNNSSGVRFDPMNIIIGF